MDQANQVPPLQPTEKKSVGPIIGIVIIVIVLIAGALYFWGASLNRGNSLPPITEPAPLSDSDSVDDISADLSATAINGLDEDLGAIDAELDASASQQ